jgi:hypothetical protein
MSVNLISLLVQVAVLLAAGLAAYFGFVVRISSRVTSLEGNCTSHNATLAKVDLLTTEMERVKGENLLFWKVIEPHLGNIIHSPIHKTRDELVENLIAGTLTDEEALILVNELNKALHDPAWSEEKRLAGALLLARAEVISRRKQA